MNKQRGSGLVAALVFAGILFVMGIAFVSMFIGAGNYANESEKGIVYAYENLENVSASYTTKIMEMAQVNAMYTNDLTEVVTAAMEGRYGENGSAAVFQWIKENNPNFDSRLYTRLQDIMEAGRNEFKVSQTAFIDRKREYETAQGYFVKGFFIKLAGYPKINMADYKTISSTHAKKVFETGVDDGVKLNP